MDRDTLRIGYRYQISEPFEDDPPIGGKLFVTLKVSGAARDVKVDVDESGTNFTITAPRDIEAKDWCAKPFRKNAGKI